MGVVASELAGDDAVDNNATTQRSCQRAMCCTAADAPRPRAIVAACCGSPFWKPECKAPRPNLVQFNNLAVSKDKGAFQKQTLHKLPACYAVTQADCWSKLLH